MNKLLVIALASALVGCAEMPRQQGYGNGAYAQPRDPSQWRVVSVTPVAAGTAAKVAAKSSDGKPVEYSSRPAPQPTYSNAPVYGQAPIYGRAPVYGPAPLYGQAPVYGQEPIYGQVPVYAPQPYYWPPVTLSLGFMFGRHWSRGFGGVHFRHGRRW